jgi:hypothetical protein
MKKLPLVFIAAIMAAQSPAPELSASALQARLNYKTLYARALEIALAQRQVQDAMQTAQAEVLAKGCPDGYLMDPRALGAGEFKCDPKPAKEAKK